MKLNYNIAIKNSYELVFNNKHIDEFTDVSKNYFLHNPLKEINKRELEFMFDYFWSKRMYSKCLKISAYIAKIKYKNGIQRLSNKYYRQGM